MKNKDEILENDREWRSYMLDKIEDIHKNQIKHREDFVLFKGKAFGLIAILVVFVDIIKAKFFGK